MEYAKGKRIIIEKDKCQETGGRARDIHENPEKKKQKREKTGKINGKVKKKKRQGKQTCRRAELNTTPRKHTGKRANIDTGSNLRRNGGEQSASRPGHFNPSIHCTSGWVCCTADVYVVVKRWLPLQIEPYRYASLNDGDMF